MPQTLNKNSRERERESSLHPFKFYKIPMDKALKNILGLFLVFTFVFLGAFALTNTVSASTCLITTTLKLGSRGNDVKCLQTNLNLKADGQFGPKTKIAVIAWQKSKGLTADGIFGAKSRAVFVTNTINTISKTFPSGCSSTSGFSITTGVSCLIFYGGGGGGGGGSTSRPVTAISVITGTPEVGQVLTAGTLVPTGATASFQWQISATEDGTYADISGASSSTYTILASDVTKFIKVKATGTGGYNSTVTSAVTAVVAPAPVNISSIAGITVPIGGATPTATIADTTEYTAIIAWAGSPTTFTGNTAYTATITLTPKTGYTVTGISANFFTVAGATATNTINTGVVTAVFPATSLIQLTISDPTLSTSKIYNGSTGATVTAGSLTGIIAGDIVTVTGVATYDTKDVGTTKTITVVYTLGGADAGKYIKPVNYTTSTGIITNIQLTISNPTLTNQKEYDRTTSAVVTAGSLTGVVDGGVTVSAIATYDSPAVNTGKTITVVYTLAGINAGNYIKPVDRLVYSGIITQKQLTISSPTITTSKLYDRSTSVVATIGTLSGVIGTDVTVSGVATYDNANVGTGKTITLVYTLSGAEAGNYIKPVNDTTTSGIVTAIQLTIPSPTLTTTKVYDADTTAVVTAGALSGILTPDAVTVSAVATYDTALPGTSKTITVVYTLAGAQSGNYIKPVNYTTATGVITAIVINTPAIAGVTAPATDATPVSSLADGTGYTATISWSPSGAIFLNTTVYTATVTLTPKTGYTLTGVGTNFFTVSGATATNTANTGIVSAVFPITQAYATVPSSIVLAVGSTAPVGGVTNVAIPAVDGTDTTGVITGWVPTTADKIKFTVTDNGGTSTITINGAGYTSGADYQVVPTTSFPTVVVTTTQTNRTTAVRTFIITGPILGSDGLAYGIVIGPETPARKWLDRNLGATRVATSFDDYQAYGSLFQWGRAADGHQLITHTTATAATPVNGNTSSLASSDTPGDNLFIKAPSSPYDWRSPQNNNLWQGVNGVNNPCPTGFRLPTNTEQGALITAAGITNSATAYSSSLKLTVGGVRNSSDASLANLGTFGYYWSSSVSVANALYFYFNASAVHPAYAGIRASGYSVRCVKD